MKVFIVWMTLLNGTINVPTTPVIGYSIIDSGRKLVDGINKGMNSLARDFSSWFTSLIK